MPPRVRLTPDEAANLPGLLTRTEALRAEFPSEAGATEQAAWIRRRYSDGAPLTVNLVTLLLFEHGVHRSVDQVSKDLAMLREDTEPNES